MLPFGFGKITQHGKYRGGIDYGMGVFCRIGNYGYVFGFLENQGWVFNKIPANDCMLIESTWGDWLREKINSGK